MPVFVQWPTSGALERRLREIQEAAGSNSRQANRVKGDIRKIVIDDNTEKLLGRGLLEGVDRYGKPLAPMAESTYQNPRRGFGPVLAPKGLRSGFITHFQAAWKSVNGFSTLVMGWKDLVSKQGRPFAQYHLTGAPRGSKPGQPNWSLPKRDIGGVSPQGWAKIVARHKKFAEDVLKGT